MVCAGESLWRAYASHGAMRKDDDEDDTEMSDEELFFQPEPRENSTKRRVCSEGEASSRRVQQHFLHPCNPWM